MGRQYSVEHYRERLDRIRAAVPGHHRLDRRHRRVLRRDRRPVPAHARGLLEAVRYDQVFAAAYSPRPGTPATRLADDVPAEVKRERLNELLRLQEGDRPGAQRGLAGPRCRGPRGHGDTAALARPRPVAGHDAGGLAGRTRGNKLVHLPAGRPIARVAGSRSASSMPVRTPSWRVCPAEGHAPGALTVRKTRVYRSASARAVTLGRTRRVEEESTAGHDVPRSQSKGSANDGLFPFGPDPTPRVGAGARPGRVLRAGQDLAPVVHQASDRHRTVVADHQHDHRRVRTPADDRRRERRCRPRRHPPAPAPARVGGRRWRRSASPPSDPSRSTRWRCRT